MRSARLRRRSAVVVLSPAIIFLISLNGCGPSSGSYRELAIGVYLMQNERGSLDLLLDRFAAQQTGSAGKLPGGVVLVSNVRSLCIIPQKAILGSALSAVGATVYFIVDIAPKPAQIEDPAMFSTEAEMRAKATQLFGVPGDPLHAASVD